MREAVEEYYGSVLKTSQDLKTNACTTAAAPSDHIRALISQIHEGVTSTYYGCGLVYPASLAGKKVLDLGCGSGRDCYVLSQLVGESGRVVGVDMTDEQLEIAERYIEFHTQKFGYQNPNVSFRKGYLEQLDELDLEPNSFDVIVSNCVINLAIDKPAVLKHAFNLLADGGELYFSDVYCDRRVPASLARDPELYGECLSGALYWNDFLNIAKVAGFRDPRLVEDSAIVVTEPEVREKVGALHFYSATYRLFKLAALESACEDYGQAVKYLGNIPSCPETFVLDKHHHFERGKVYPVCGNTLRMLQQTRFSSAFDYFGNWDTHYGIFDGCGTALPFEQTRTDESETMSSSCC